MHQPMLYVRVIHPLSSLLSVDFHLSALAARMHSFMAFVNPSWLTIRLTKRIKEESVILYSNML